METNYAIVQNSTGNGLNALVMRSWYVDEEGNQVTIKSEVKTNLTLDQCFELYQAFMRENKEVSNG